MLNHSRGGLSGLVNRLFSRTHRRTDPLPAPFPDPWHTILQYNVPFYRRLPSQENRDQLQRDLYWFVSHKRWTPFDIDIDDRKKVIVAAHACLLLNGRLDLGVFPRTREIIIRPGVFGTRVQTIAPDGRLFEMHDARIGEAWYRGPIVLSWDAIEPLTLSPHPARNVIVHEFAHALDHLDGYADGTPPLENRRAVAEWAEAFTREFEHLRDLADGGHEDDIDPYGATNPAEFFAVVAEHFYCRAHTLRRRHADLYEQLHRFFCQDPSAWED